MRKQLRHSLAVVGSNRVLLFVLIFSMLVSVFSGYRILVENRTVLIAHASQDALNDYRDKVIDFGRYAELAESNASAYGFSADVQFLGRSSAAIDTLQKIFRQLKEAQFPAPDAINPGHLAAFLRISAEQIDRFDGNGQEIDTGAGTGRIRRVAIAGGFTDSLVLASQQVAREMQLAIDKLNGGILRADNRNGYLLSLGVIALFSLMTLVFCLLLKTITRHHKAGEELKWQRAYFNTALDSLGDGLISRDADGRIVLMNSAAETITGRGQQEVYPTPKHKVLNLVPGGDAQSRKLSGSNRWKVSVEMLSGKKNLPEVPETTAVPLRNTEKKMIALLGVPGFITEKKQREERILKENGLLESVINHLPGVFYLLDEKLQFLRWNTNLETITGYRADEIAQMHLIDFIDPEDRPQITEKISELLAKGCMITEVAYRTKQGKKIPYHLVSHKLENRGNIQFLGAGYDMSDRKKSEAITRSAIERYDILARATSDTIWDWNIVTNTIAYNKGINKMFGYKAVEVENVVTWWNNKLHPEDIDQVRESLTEIFDKKQQRIQLNYRFRCADGSYKHIFDRAFVIFDEHGIPKRMIGAMQDVTFKVLEESRMAKAIIDAQEQERNHLGAELHDNVNQILAGSLLHLSIAKSEKMDTHKVVSLIETTMSYIRHAIDETRRLSHHLAPASFEYSSLKNSIQTLLFNINVDHRYQINFRFEELNTIDTPEKIKINLYRILQEQVKNIDKYSKAQQIDVEVAVYDDRVRMRTADNGKGFNIKQANKGIGLDNMKRRVESFSGKFTINSAPGSGCEIIVEIPTNLKKSQEE